MRQAGRYLPEFRALRKSHDFFSMCSSPTVAAEITLQPLRRFKGLLDAVVIFSDILIVPQAMGMECKMVPGKGPVFPHPLRVPGDVDKLCLSPSTEAGGPFEPLYAAIRETRRLMEDEVPVVGFCGGPWTLLAYMVDGGGSKTHNFSKGWMFKLPDASKALLEHLADALTGLLVGQWKAGASILQVFESSAGELSPRDFREFSLPYLRRIARGVRALVPSVDEGGPPIAIFSRCAHHCYEELAVEFDVISVDWAVEPSEVVHRVQATTGRKARALQGNLDPGRLYGSAEGIREATKHMLASFEPMPLIANLGWGMHPTHDPEALKAYFQAVRDESTKARAAPAAE